MDFDRLVEWLKRFAPADVNIHVSGGEPLLRPDIETQVDKLLVQGIRVTVFTNGMLIHKRTRLTDMPLNWVIAHHPPNPLQKWRENVMLVAHRPFLTKRVIANRETFEKKSIIGRDYDGLNFHWQRMHGLLEYPWQINLEDLSCVPSTVIHLAVPDGRVFPCNNSRYVPVGNIRDMFYHPENAMQYNRKATTCVTAGICPAYQSAVILNEFGT